ncbi:hypothetical protein ACFQ9X_28300 [Catenulispora yoronensis]
MAADKRLGVIMACRAQQQAFGLQLSSTLADLLKTGLDDGQDLIRIETAAPVLQGRIAGQSIVPSVHNGNLVTPSPLWLGMNRRSPSRLIVDDIGPLGRVRLEAARRAYPAAAAQPAGLWDDSRLAEVRSELLRGPRSREDERLLRVLIQLDAAAKTVVLLRTMSQLTTPRLRAALTALLAAEEQLCSTGALNYDLVDVVDYVVFNHPAGNPDHRRWLARLVALIDAECPQHLDAARTLEWARAVRAGVQLADAREFVAGRRRDQQLRLVVSTNQFTEDWPQELQTWLLLNGELPAVGNEDFRNRFECPTVDKEGADQALAAAVAWGKDTAQRKGLELWHIDVAARAAVLMQWRPEEAKVDGQLLGVDHMVVTHWSPRMGLPEPSMPKTDVVLRRLERIENAVADKLAWLGVDATCDTDALLGKMVFGQYQQAIAVGHQLGVENTRLVDILCAYVPIVMWWCHPDSALGLAAKAGVEQFWGQLPNAFILAYRERWLGEHVQGLADFRALWDDKQWLTFCKNFSMS